MDWEETRNEPDQFYIDNIISLRMNTILVINRTMNPANKKN